MNFPAAEIYMLAKPWVAPVFEHSPHIDRMIIYPSEGGRHNPMGIFRMAGELRRMDFDIAVLLQNAVEAAIIAFMSQIPMRLGFDTDARRALLTHPVHCTSMIKSVHQTQYYQYILKGAGLDTGPNTLSLSVGDTDRADAKHLLRQFSITDTDFIIGINPGATFGSAKRWPPDRFVELCRRLIRDFDARILIFGGPGETVLGDTICSEIGDKSVNLCGKTRLGQAFALLDTCRLVISNDSGLMHVAAALDKPQIAVFGSTNAITTGPLSPKSHIVRVPMSCSPCMKTDCPLGHHRCMNAITVDLVYEKARQLTGNIL